MNLAEWWENQAIREKNSRKQAFEELRGLFKDKLEKEVWVKFRGNCPYCGSRRNPSDAWRIELALQNKADLTEVGREKQRSAIQDRDEKGRAKPVLSQNDKTGPKHNTRKEIAKAAAVIGVSGKPVSMAKAKPLTLPKQMAYRANMSLFFKDHKAGCQSMHGWWGGHNK